VLATATRPGAIAILQLIGESESMLRELTGVGDWPVGRMRLVDLAGIDEGLAVRLTERVTQLMPHGGPRVVQQLTTRLRELGAEIIADAAASDIDPRELYPEAQDSVEAIMLQTLARAQSPLAIDLLLDQPSRWRAAAAAGSSFSSEDQARSARLNRLIDPPIVVLAGQPNVGKSTLSNALLGRAMSIAFDRPGTTRDYTSARIELAGLVVDWHDTPGIRTTSDVIEQRAIELARRLIDRADLLIAMSDHEHDWPELPREPDLRIFNKIDLDQSSKRSKVLGVSAKTGAGMAELVTAVRSALVPDEDLMHPAPWVIDERLVSNTSAPCHE
jgi:tRNA modification GTPase